MTTLSPAAQAVIDAAMNTPMSPDGPLETRRLQMAAAIRAAVEQPYEVPCHIRGDNYWTYLSGVDTERERLLAIATELENHQ